MRKLGFGLVAASALLMSGVSTTPARADAGLTAILLGTVVVATVACQPGNVVPAGQVVCLFSPFTWFAPAQPVKTVKVKTKKSKKK